MKQGFKDTTSITLNYQLLLSVLPKPPRVSESISRHLRPFGSIHSHKDALCNSIATLDGNRLVCEIIDLDLNLVAFPAVVLINDTPTPCGIRSPSLRGVLLRNVTINIYPGGVSMMTFAGINATVWGTMVTDSRHNKIKTDRTGRFIHAAVADLYQDV